MSELSEQARRLLEGEPIVERIETPVEAQPSLFRDPLTFILMLPFLPFYLLAMILSSTQTSQRRIAVTEIERTPGGGWKIFEYER